MNLFAEPSFRHAILALLALPASALIVSASLGYDPATANTSSDRALLALPSSNVLPLPDFRTTAIFPISYEAIAGDSPLDYVELYYSRDNSGWAKYGEKFSSSPIDFDSAATGGDGRYRFYTVAVDTAAGAEPPPADLVPDASTIVDTNPPSFLLDLSPTVGGTGDPFSFAAVVVDANGPRDVTVEHWRGSGPPQTMALALDGAAFTATIVLATNVTDTLSYRYSATDGAGNRQTATVQTVAVVDNDLPQVRIVELTGGDLVRGGSSLTLAWTAGDNVGLTPYSTVISTSMDGGSSWTELGSGYPNDGSIAWVVPSADTRMASIAVATADSTGNMGRATLGTPLAIDSSPPTTIITSPASVATNSFIVSWSATDNLAGVSRYQVQFRVGEAGPWQDWFAGGVPFSVTQGIFGPTEPAPISDGSVFYLRARATDTLGNEEAFSQPSQQSRTNVARFRTYIPLSFGNYCPEPPSSINNGTFERGFDGWLSGGGLPSSVIDGAGPQATKALLLGNPGYACNDYGEPTVLVDQSAWARQRTAVSSCPYSAVLAFAFRMVTFDVDYSDFYQQYVDTFEFSVRDADTGELLHLWRYGNADHNSFGCSRQKDFGWQEHSVDLSAHRGRNVEVEFSNWNRIDGYLNTYTYVDNVRFR